MLRVFCFNFVTCYASHKLGVHLSDLAPYYHTTDVLHQELLDLQSRCPELSVETDSTENVSIDVVNIRKPGVTPQHKTFMLFGEHSRELVSPESALHFIKTLCGETDVPFGDQLDHTEFQIIVNGNPNSRRRVEQGEYCLRVNSNGVDLNRNWDEKWKPSPVLDPSDTNPGPEAFSEDETKIFRDRVTAFNPTTFLTIHSGTKGMYMPWAYDMEHLAQRNEGQMLQILRELDKDYCQCPFGAAGREVGYSCPGTCLDYVYDKLNADFSFAFEIYTDPGDWGDLKQRFKEKLRKSFLQRQRKRHNLAHSSMGSFFKDHPSDFVQLAWNKTMRRGSNRESNPANCFAQFNPPTEELLKSTLNNWTKVYIDLGTKIHKLLESRAYT